MDIRQVMVTHTGGKGRQISEASLAHREEFQDRQGCTEKPCLNTKQTKKNGVALLIDVSVLWLLGSKIMILFSAETYLFSYLNEQQSHLCLKWSNLISDFMTKTVLLEDRIHGPFLCSE